MMDKENLDPALSPASKRRTQLEQWKTKKSQQMKSQVKRPAFKVSKNTSLSAPKISTKGHNSTFLLESFNNNSSTDTGKSHAEKFKEWKKAKASVGATGGAKKSSAPAPSLKVQKDILSKNILDEMACQPISTHPVKDQPQHTDKKVTACQKLAVPNPLVDSNHWIHIARSFEVEGNLDDAVHSIKEGLLHNAHPAHALHEEYCRLLDLKISIEQAEFKAIQNTVEPGKSAPAETHTPAEKSWMSSSLSSLSDSDMSTPSAAEEAATQQAEVSVSDEAGASTPDTAIELSESGAKEVSIAHRLLSAATAESPPTAQSEPQPDVEKAAISVQKTPSTSRRSSIKPLGLNVNKTPARRVSIVSPQSCAAQRTFEKPPKTPHSLKRQGVESDNAFDSTFTVLTPLKATPRNKKQLGEDVTHIVTPVRRSSRLAKTPTAAPAVDEGLQRSLLVNLEETNYAYLPNKGVENSSRRPGNLFALSSDGPQQSGEELCDHPLKNIEEEGNEASFNSMLETSGPLETDSPTGPATEDKPVADSPLENDTMDFSKYFDHCEPDLVPDQGHSDGEAEGGMQGQEAAGLASPVGITQTSQAVLNSSTPPSLLAEAPMKVTIGLRLGQSSLSTPPSAPAPKTPARTPLLSKHGPSIRVEVPKNNGMGASTAEIETSRVQLCPITPRSGRKRKASDDAAYLTPVRRSTRIKNSTTPSDAKSKSRGPGASTLEMLEEVNFAYKPNKYI